MKITKRERGWIVEGLRTLHNLYLSDSINNATQIDEIFSLAQRIKNEVIAVKTAKIQHAENTTERQLSPWAGDLNETLNKIELIKLAVNEWANNELTSDEAMIRISVVLSIRKPPGKKATEWAKALIK